MSKKKTVPRNGADLNDVTVPVRQKQRRDAELSDVNVELGRQQRRQAEPSDVKVDVGRQKQRRVDEISDVVRYKQRGEVELSEVRVDVGKNKQRRGAEPSDVKVDIGRQKQKQNTHTALCGGTRSISKISSKSNEYIYDNRAYVGSLNNVNEVRTQAPPISGVYREQYWACSKWSLAKKVLAVSIGVVLGAGIGLAIILVVTGKDAEDVIGGIFLSSAPD